MRHSVSRRLPALLAVLVMLAALLPGASAEWGTTPDGSPIAPFCPHSDTTNWVCEATCSDEGQASTYCLTCGSSLSWRRLPRLQHKLRIPLPGASAVRVPAEPACSECGITYGRILRGQRQEIRLNGNISIEVSRSKGSGAVRLGDVLLLQAVVTNSGLVTLTNVELWIRGEYVGTLETLIPGDTWAYYWGHTVTENDMDLGMVYVHAYACANDSDTTQVSCYSELLTVPCRGDDLLVTITPANYEEGASCSVGQCVEYYLTVTNLSDSPLEEVSLAAANRTDYELLLESIELQPGESRSVFFSRVVTEEDLLDGRAVVFAAASCFSEETGELDHYLDSCSLPCE